MLEVISSFRSWRAGSQGFDLLMLFLCMILHTMWLGKSLHLVCILPLGILCLYAIRMMFCDNYFGSVHVGGYCGLSESRLVSLVNCVQSAFM